MTRIVQVAGGSANHQNAYTGPTRELTVDESNGDIRVHNGSTPGGKVVQNRDNADARYQPKSLELNGLTGFTPEQRGFLVRLGPSDYRLRTITVNGAQLTITSADGYAGNPLIGLAQTITTSHTWTGQQIFSDVCEFSAGINADVAGDLTGNVLGNVSGDVVGNLTGNAEGNHTGSFMGDVNVSENTVTFADNQIPTSAVNQLVSFIKLHAVPLGTIVMWSGSIASIPTGWYLCNGTNSTPDLRDRFVVGAGSVTYPVGATGGSWTHIHNGVIANSGAHTHTGTVGGTALTESQMPAHKHGTGILDAGTAMFNHGSFPASPTTADSIDNNGSAGINEAWSTTVGGGETHTHSLIVDANSNHTHSIDISEQSNIPPYYALCFIMRGA